jgi:hypothetical protein
MNSLDNHVHVALQKGQAMRLEHGNASRIFCCEGSLWLTRDGDIRDVVLRQGQSLTFEGKCGILLSAFEPAKFSLRKGSPSSERKHDLAFYLRWVGRKYSAIFA